MAQIGLLLVMVRYAVFEYLREGRGIDKDIELPFNMVGRSKYTVGCREHPPHGAPWVSGLVGHFVQTWPDSECSHTVQFSDCRTITFFSSGLCDIIIII